MHNFIYGLILLIWLLGFFEIVGAPLAFLYTAAAQRCINCEPALINEPQAARLSRIDLNERK